MRTVFRKTLVRADHFRSFEVHSVPYLKGWETSERADQTLVDQQRHSDWHRVEQVLSRFQQQIVELRAAGWEEA